MQIAYVLTTCHNFKYFQCHEFFCVFLLYILDGLHNKTHKINSIQNSSYTLLACEEQFASLRISAEVPTSSVCLYVQQHPDILLEPAVLADLDKNPS